MLKRIKYPLIGYVLFLQICIAIVIISTGRDYTQLLWYCNHICLLVLVGLITDQIDMVKGVVAIGAIGQGVWCLDAIILLLYEISPFGYTEYLVTLPSVWIFLYTLCIHACSVSIVIVGTAPVQSSWKSLGYAGGYLVLMFGLSYLIPEMIHANINLMSSFDLFNWSGIWYRISWPILVWAGVAVPGYVLIRCIEFLVIRFFRSDQL